MRRSASIVVLMCASPLFAQDKRVGDGWVVLPAEEYRTLRSKAYPPDRPPDPPPVDATVSRVEYELRADGDMAAGEAKVGVDVFKEGWVRVPVPSGLLVREARLDGRTVPLVEGKVLLARTGRSLLVLEVVVPITAQAGWQSLSLPASSAPVLRAALAISRRGVSVSARGGALLEEAETEQGTRVVAYGSANTNLSLSWRQKKEDNRGAQPLRLRGSITEVVGLGEESSSVSAEVNLEVVQGRASLVALAVPAGFAIHEVAGPLVADWEASPSALRVSFLEPVDKAAAFTVSGEMRLPRAGRIDVPLLRLAAAERETGGVAVEVLGSGEIDSEERVGLQAADPSDLGASIARRDSPTLSAFRFLPLGGDAGRRLSVHVTRFDSQAALVAIVDEARYRVLLTEDGKTLVEARYAVRNNQRSFLGMALPPGAVLWSARVQGRPVRPGQSAEGAMLLPLVKARAAEESHAFPVEVVYLDRGSRWTEKGTSRLPLPTLDLPVTRTGVTVEHSPRFRMDLSPGTFRIAPDEAPFSAALREGSEESPSDGDAKMAAAKDKSEAGAQSSKELDDLIGRFQRVNRGSRQAGLLPVEVRYPDLGGPSLFLAAELTPENVRPDVALAYKRTN